MKGFKWLADDEARFRAMCSAAAEELAAYRKALEPFAREFAQHYPGSPMWTLDEVALNEEEVCAMKDAAFRMGLLSPPHRRKPSSNALASPGSGPMSPKV